MQSILVTGASGFVGASIVKRLVLDGHNVRIMLRPQSTTHRLAGLLDRVEVLHGDFEDLGAVDQSLRARKIDAVIHTAWGGVAAASRNSIAQLTDNITGTIKLCEMAAGRGCSTFIGMGSQAEYGPVNDILTEQTVPQPDTAYGFAKVATANICAKLCELAQMRFIWLRLLSVYGPCDDSNHMVPYVIRSLLHEEKPHISNGSQSWDYLYIDDCASAISAALASKANGIYVLGSGHSTTIRTVVEIIRDKIDPALPIGFGVPSERNAALSLRADVSRLIAATGWSPNVSLEEGLSRTIASIRAEDRNAVSPFKAVLHGV